MEIRQLIFHRIYENFKVIKYLPIVDLKNDSTIFIIHL